MRKTLFNCDFIDCTYTYEGVELDGLFVHGLNDEFGNGDGVIGNACTMPDTDEDAEAMLINEYLETDLDSIAPVTLHYGDHDEVLPFNED